MFLRLQRRCHKHNTAFLVDGGVLEHYRIENGYIGQQDQRDEASNNSPDEELIAPHIDSPLSEILFLVGPHAEAANSLPCSNIGCPVMTRLYYSRLLSCVWVSPDFIV